MKKLIIKIRLTDDSDGALSHAIFRGKRAVKTKEVDCFEVVDKAGNIVHSSLGG